MCKWSWELGAGKYVTESLSHSLEMKISALQQDKWIENKFASSEICNVVYRPPGITVLMYFRKSVWLDKSMCSAGWVIAMFSSTFKHENLLAVSLVDFKKHSSISSIKIWQTQIFGFVRNDCDHGRLSKWIDWWIIFARHIVVPATMVSVCCPFGLFLFILMDEMLLKVCYV